MKGICFKEPLFLATIAGKKTQTRRNISIPKGAIGYRTSKNIQGIITEVCALDENERPINPRTEQEWVILPKYRAGERIYLKEPYFLCDEVEGLYYNLYKFNKDELPYTDSKWKNKLFMPESDARYFIEITDVRCERLQDITEEDCIKEGIIKNEEAKPIGYPFGIKFPFNNGMEKANYSTAKEAYAALYDKINGKGTWDSNPYVWVYDYKLVEQ